MFVIFKAALSPMLVMFLCIIFGFIINKKKLMPENSANVLSKLENYVICPCLIINNFMTYCTTTSLKNYYPIVIYSIIACLVAIFIAIFLSKFFVKEGYGRNIYKYALTFANFGFMGNAIVPQLLGEEILYNYMLFTLPLNVAVYSWGVTNLIIKKDKDKKVNPLKNLINPIFFSILIGMFIGILNLKPYIPYFITSTISNFAVCMGPIAMFLTGFVIGDFDLVNIFKNTKVYIATFLRLLILPTILVLLLKLLGANALILKLCLFAYATPIGLNTVIFPAAYGGDATTGASMAMISHTLSIITIPIMYSLLTLII